MPELRAARAEFGLRMHPRSGAAEAIAERVLKIEHELLPFVIEKFATNKILFENNRVDILQ